MTTRFYLPASGTPAVSPGYGTAWEYTTLVTPAGPALRRPLVTTPTNTTLSTQLDLIPPGTTLVDSLAQQWVSEPLTGATISGTFTLVFPCASNSATLDAMLQCVIRVVSNNGATERAVLYGGQTVSTVSASTSAANYELFVSSNLLANMRTRVLTGTLTGYTSATGDRLVVEIGARAVAPNGSSRHAFFAPSDPTGVSDFAATVDLVGGAGRPWIEFTHTFTPAPTGATYVTDIATGARLKTWSGGSLYDIQITS